MVDKQVRELGGGTENQTPSLDDVLLTQVDETDGATTFSKISRIRDLIRGFGSNVKQRKTASSSTDLEFDVTGLNGVVEFMLESLVPATDGQQLKMEVYANGSWQTTNYAWFNDYNNSIQNPTAHNATGSTEAGDATGIRLSGAVGSASGEGVSGRVRLIDPDSTTRYKHITGEMSYLNASADQLGVEVSGTYKGGLQAITKVRFKFASGNIASGVIAMLDPYAGGNMNPLAAAVRYTTNAGQEMDNGSYEIVNYEDLEQDDDGLVTVGASWKYTASKAQEVWIQAAVQFVDNAWTDGEQAALHVYKNGSDYARLDLYECESSETRGVQLAGGTSIPLAEGDYIDIRVFQGSGAGLNLISTNGQLYNYVIVTEVPSRLSTLDPAVRAKWSSGYTYAQGDITVKDGRTYKSVADSNLGNDPATDGGTNWVLQPEVATGDYAFLSMSSGQNNVSDGDLVNFVNVEGNLSLSNNKVTLKANKTYVLLASIRINWNDNGGWCLFNWYDETGTAYIPGQARSHPSTFNYNESINPSICTVFTPEVDSEVSLRIEDVNTNGVHDLISTTHAVIHQIGVGSYVPLMAPIRYTRNSTLSLPHNTEVIFDVDDKDYDDDGRVTTGATTWEFEAPHSGKYRVRACALIDVTSDLDIGEAAVMVLEHYVSSWNDYSNLDRQQMQASPTGYYQMLKGSDEIDLQAGEKIRVFLLQTSNATLQTIASASYNYVIITEIPTSTSVPTHGWTSWTPTINWSGGVGTVLGRYKDLGNELDCEVFIPITGSVTPTSTNLLIDIPSGFAIDFISAQSDFGEFRFGDTTIDDATGSFFGGVLNDGSNNDKVQPTVHNAAGTYVVQGGVDHDTPVTLSNGDTIHCRFKIPVTRT